MSTLYTALSVSTSREELVDMVLEGRVEIDRLRAHPVFARADYHAPHHSRLVIDFAEGKGAIRAFNAFADPDSATPEHGDGGG